MTIIRAYLVDLKYTVEENVIVHLFCRTEDGKLVVIRDFYRPNFYALPKENVDVSQLISKIAKLKLDEENHVTSTNVVKKTINCREEKFLKIHVSKPGCIRPITNIIEKWNDIINCFEHDISLTRKYILDNRIIPFSIFEAEVVDKDMKEGGHPAYKLVKFLKKDLLFAKPRTLSASIAFEEDTRGNKTISGISYSYEETNRIITWKNISKSIPEIEKVKSEEEILISFKRKLQELQPDLILFEDRSSGLISIMERAKKYHLKMNINFDSTEPYVNSISKKTRTLGINEIFIKRIISNFINLSLVKEDLHEIYQTIQGVVSISSMANSTEDDQMVGVMLQKSRLNYLLFNSLYENLTELFRLLGLRLADLLNFSLRSVVEWILIKESIQKGHIILNKPRFEEDNKNEFKIRKYKPVIDPVAGIYENIIKISLTPIYPQIIIKDNLSSDTVNCNCCDGICKNNTGLLPSVLIDIGERIKRIDLALSKEKNDNLERRKNILIRIQDYFYEYLNLSNSRWYSLELIEMVNSRAKKEINSIISYTNKKNSVVYSDYNELYVSLNEDAKTYISEIHKRFPLASNIKLKESYKSGLFLPREDTRSSKKRLVLKDNNNNITESNIIRFTHPEYIKRAIEKIIKGILNNRSKEEIITEARRIIERLSSQGVDTADLIIRSKLIKNIDEYNEKSIQFHVINALKAKSRNVKRNDYIEYIITSLDEPISRRAKIPEDMAGLKYDADYYTERILMPAIEDLLLLKGITKEELREPKNQSDLGSFI